MEDLEGWEVLPDDGFLQIHDDEGKKIFSRNYRSAGSTVFKNYFICPSSNSTKFVDSTKQQDGEEHFNSRTVPNQHRLPVPIIDLNKAPDDYDQVNFKDICENPLGKSIKPSPLLVENPKEADQDPVSQVFFKKMKETEFVDMKILESPTRVMKPPPLPVDSIPAFQLVEGKGESFDMKIASPRSLMKGEEQRIINGGWVEEKDSGSGGGGFDIWKWSLTGVGAICSFGVAAATVCIIFFGARHRNAKHHDENHRIQFHLYADDKRLKEVMRHATKLNEAMSATRGSGSGPLSLGTAHITSGGYYDEAL